MSDRPTLLLEHHLKELKLPTFLREYGKIAAQCASEGVDHPDYLLRLAELELIDRHHRMVARRIKAARFPALKSLDTFDFPAIPSVNRQLVTQLARCEYIETRERHSHRQQRNRQDAHRAGPGSCRLPEGTDSGLHHCVGPGERAYGGKGRDEAADHNSASTGLLFEVFSQRYERGFVPLSRTGSELLFEVFSQRYERGSVLVTTNLPFDEWTEMFGSERLTGALLDRLTHHVHIIEMNGDSYRLRQSSRTASKPS